MARGEGPVRRRRPDLGSLEGGEGGAGGAEGDVSSGPKQRFGRGLAAFCNAVILLGWVLDRTTLIPSILVRVVAVVGVCLLLARLLAFKRWKDETCHLRRFCFYMVAMLVELAVENFLVWVVSATDVRKYDRVPGLQDNVNLILSKLRAMHPLLQWAIHFHWAHIFQFLGVILALAFSVLWDQVPYSGFGMMARVVLTICLSRIVRTVCFLVTVLPNPRMGCYSSRFPPVPSSTWDFVQIGFRKMMGTGGCNDLIFSGHCGVWALAPLAYHSYYSGRCCWLLWAALLQTSLRTVAERHHYSVDMVLAVVITAFVWRELDWVCPSGIPLPPRPKGSPPDPLSPALAAFVGLLVTGVVVAIVVSGS
eukprot:evm.model.scf_156.15 EVM.evm.TU.scf_156.15   scf_156:117852-121906(+)